METYLEKLQKNSNAPLSESPSPFGRWLNPIVRVASEGYLELEFLVRDDMTNPAGIIHGGVIASMLDETIGIMMYCLPQESFRPSINLITDFLSPAKPGDKLLVKAKVTKQGKNLLHGMAQMYRLEDQRIIATGSAHHYQK